VTTFFRILEAHQYGAAGRKDAMQSETSIPAAPAGYATVSPFIIAHDANGLIGFLKQVFRASERPEARTLDDDGLLLHAELAIGNATIMFGERKPGWPFTPSLLQVYVDDVETTLSVARQLGATVVTEPTDFFGDTFSRSVTRGATCGGSTVTAARPGPATRRARTGPAMPPQLAQRSGTRPRPD
jgi:uncharacterized glyoxalase superfamily protein PhnB